MNDTTTVRLGATIQELVAIIHEGDKPINGGKAGKVVLFHGN